MPFIVWPPIGPAVDFPGNRHHSRLLDLLLFAIGLRAYLRRGEREPRTLSSLILIVDRYRAQAIVRAREAGFARGAGG